MNPKFLQKCIKQASSNNAAGKYSTAKTWCDKALKQAPDIPEAWYNLGLALRGLGQQKNALSAFKKASHLVGDSADAQNSIGLALLEMHAIPYAEKCFKQALIVDPNFAFAHSNLGKLYQIQKRIPEAFQAFRRAAQLQPNIPQLHYNLGSILREKDRFTEAAESFKNCLKIDPNTDYCFGDFLDAKTRACEWTNINSELSLLAEKIENGEKAANPFSILSLLDDPSIQRKAAEIYVKDKFTDNLGLPSLGKRPKSEIIRIGYYSGDFRNHPLSYLTAQLFELHNKNLFETYAFSFGENTGDRMRKRMEQAFTHFIDVKDMSDLQIAKLSRESKIDIGVDLGGFTDQSRFEVFSARVAPIQVAYLGYPGTTGAPFIDYLIADRTLIPEHARQHYTENVVFMPRTYWVTDTSAAVSERRFSNAELGLPDDAFVFCCFNKNYKILPATYDIWMRILDAVPNSVLWLLENTEVGSANLRREAELRGVDGKRIVFAPRMSPVSDHLARHRNAHLFLDTLPYNAHTTSSDALWAGLPVLTCTGKSFASRVATSLLQAVNLPELITSTREDFEKTAINLANNPQWLERIRGKLNDNDTKAKAFNTQLFTDHIQCAYKEMYQRHLNNLPPKDIFVDQ